MSRPREAGETVALVLFTLWCEWLSLCVSTGGGLQISVTDHRFPSFYLDRYAVVICPVLWICWMLVREQVSLQAVVKSWWEGMQNCSYCNLAVSDHPLFHEPLLCQSINCSTKVCRHKMEVDNANMSFDMRMSCPGSDGAHWQLASLQTQAALPPPK